MTPVDVASARAFRRHAIRTLAAALTLAAIALPARATEPGKPSATAAPTEAVPDLLVDLVLGASDDPARDLAALDAGWHPGMVPMAMEILRFARDPTLREGLVELLEDNTGESHGADIDRWYRWLWSRPEQRHPHYARFKSTLYGNIDPLFAGYFDDARDTTIRLDEARWGGVAQDGIPPLREPAMIGADEAAYLGDDDVVFGIEIDGDTRAYPKRILAWHEMFVDTVGGTEVAGVYCTLCGAVILYETEHDGIRHELGTSGFLYRSNKLMYDRATQSLWSTTLGEPVVGPLVGRGIALERGFVVTTTWGEWRRRHPDTLVLSLDTGHRRDYGEGVAYRDYFATDELMFSVPELDDRLPNKAEILALQFPDEDERRTAISADFLAERPVFHHEVGSQRVVVLTDPTGANRVYDPRGLTFVDYDGDRTVTDAEGGRWTLEEAALKHADGRRLERLPAHRAFWFGWRAVHEDTELVM